MTSPPSVVCLYPYQVTGLTTALRKAILERDDFTCAYCDTQPKKLYRRYLGGRPGTWQTHICVLHVDHIIPRSKGGSNHPLNLVTACEGCNLSKYAKLPDWIPIAECIGCGQGFRDPSDAWLNRAQGRPFFVCHDCAAPVGAA